MLNVTVFVVRVWGGQYREELMLNVTVFVVRVWGEQYREELILNVTVFVVRVWWRAGCLFVLSWDCQHSNV